MEVSGPGRGDIEDTANAASSGAITLTMTLDLVANVVQFMGARRVTRKSCDGRSQHDGRDYLPRIASNTRLKKSTTGVVAFEPTPISSPNAITR